MMKKSMIAVAICLYLALGALESRAARLIVTNAKRHPIHVSAMREGKGDKNVWHGHRRWRELNRWLDLGMFHAGETKIFDLETGKWQVQMSHRRNSPRAQGAEVRLRSQRSQAIRFE